MCVYMGGGIPRQLTATPRPALLFLKSLDTRADWLRPGRASPPRGRGLGRIVSSGPAGLPGGGAGSPGPGGTAAGTPGQLGAGQAGGIRLQYLKYSGVGAPAA